MAVFLLHRYVGVLHFPFTHNKYSEVWSGVQYLKVYIYVQDKLRYFLIVQAGQLIQIPDSYYISVTMVTIDIYTTRNRYNFFFQLDERHTFVMKWIGP